MPPSATHKELNSLIHKYKRSSQPFYHAYNRDFPSLNTPWYYFIPSNISPPIWHGHYGTVWSANLLEASIPTKKVIAPSLLLFTRSTHLALSKTSVDEHMRQGTSLPSITFLRVVSSPASHGETLPYGAVKGKVYVLPHAPHPFLL